MKMLKELQCSIFRGGTSKGVFFMKDVLPVNDEELKEVLLKVMGSPDVRQINGLGGSVSTTSKVAIISKEEKEDWDVNYTFAQVSVDKPVVSYAGNCGNISSAVGAYAIENNLVEITSPVTTVKVYNTNTKKLIYEHVPTPEGKITYNGDFSISGVPGTGSKIELEFINPAGSFTGKLLPTGNAVDILMVDGIGPVEVSIVDAANPLVYVDAKDVNLNGTEKPDEIDSITGMLLLLEKIRGEAAVKMGLVEKWQDGATLSPGVPKLTVVSKSKDYKTVSGNELKENDYDLSVRMMSMQKAHKTIALTGALCTAAACVIEGTIPNRLLGAETVKSDLKLGHGDGIIDVSIKYEKSQNGIIINSVSSHRTTRKIMTGTVYFEKE
jgi:2-methylaconitate cis-trans-isomerase PrpF